MHGSYFNTEHGLGWMENLKSEEDREEDRIRGSCWAMATGSALSDMQDQNDEEGCTP